MSELIVEVTPVLEVNPHNAADRLEIIRIKGWDVVVSKDSVAAGELVVFIPPDSILPESLHQHLGISKYCAQLPTNYYEEAPKARPTARRVKAARLRGVPSYGTIMPEASFVDYVAKIGWAQGSDTVWVEGGCVAGLLGITKWEPPIKNIPGDQEPDNIFFHKYTNIENWRNFPDWFEDGEEIIVSEKIHGCNCRLGMVQEEEGGEPIWMGGSHNTRRREFFTKKEESESSEKVEKELGPAQRTLYWQPFDWYEGVKKMVAQLWNANQKSVIVFGEIFGGQDMKYGLENGAKDFRMFDVSVGGQYMPWDALEQWGKELEIPVVPILYRGPYSREKIEELTNGPSTFDVKGKFKGREGVVIKPVQERQDRMGRRVVLKSVSVDYHNRKGATDGH